MSEIKVNSVVNSTGDNDSGLDLSTNDQVIIKTANTTAVTVDSSQNTTLAGNLTVTGNLSVTGNGNAPAFHAYHTSLVSGVSTGLSNETNVIYKPDVTSLNVDSRYSTSTGRFTPTVAGKYFCYATISVFSATSGYERTILRFLVNGTKYPASTSEFDTAFSQDSAEPTTLPVHISMIVELDADDYLELQVFHDCESSFWEFKASNCHFGAYKLIGV